MKRRSLWLILACALLTLASCGRSSLFDGDTILVPPDGGFGPCDPTTCTGCCANDTCYTGTEAQTCGGGGKACADCTKAGTPAVCATSPDGGGGVCQVAPSCTCPAGYTCDASGACVPSSKCGACVGCCNGDICELGTSSAVCGNQGGDCGTCLAGAACVATSSGGGQCVSTCSPDNCAGCCSDGTCMPGNLLTMCGTGGEACSSCTGSECAPAGPDNGGVCVATGCNAQNCPGCCDTNGLCQAGANAASCGGGGAACHACLLGEVCSGGTCVTPPTCSPTTCAGCCQGNTCVAGGMNDACGSGGEACQVCSTTANCVGNVCTTVAPCDSSVCPSGCCNDNQCLPGTNDSACGGSGDACQSCPTGTNCSAGACLSSAACGPSNCSGCCAGNACIGGTTTASCGRHGGACTSCASGFDCVNGTCEATCGPVTCLGCCQGGVCALGGQDIACGTGGDACQDCKASGAACESGSCVAQPCSPGTCSGCCDAAGKCVSGTAAAECGVAGSTCSDCASIGEVCSGGACVPTPPQCTPSSCPLGCCDASGVCQDGFLDTQCGSGGIACVDCTTTSSACDVNATPRVCGTGGTTCPSTYGGCPAGTTTQSPVPQGGACTSQDLAQVESACAGGADTTGCSAILKTLTSNGAQSCALCLQPFVVPFEEETGIALCVAPFVSASCNQATGCYTNCEKETCSHCSATQLAACQGQAATGSCSALAAGLSCMNAAEADGGAATFCNPAGYANFGAWLGAVGAVYCE